MIEAGLIVSRFVHLAAVLILFGAAAFPLYAFKEGDARDPWDALSVWLRPIVLIAAVVAFLSAVTWFGFVTANMSGSLANMFSPSILSIVVQQTDFGRIWIWRIGLAAVLVILFSIGSRRETLALLQTAGAALLLTSLGGTGHAGSTPGSLGTFHVASDSLHLLSASAWLGGLIPLARMLATAEVGDGAALDILNRFSTMAILAVAAIVASGIANSLLLFESVVSLVTTAYGGLLLGKIVLFLGMLHFAASNRFKLVPVLATFSDGENVRQRLRKNIGAELLLGLLLIAIVAVLGTLSPSGN